MTLRPPITASWQPKRNVLQETTSPRRVTRLQRPPALILVAVAIFFFCGILTVATEPNVPRWGTALGCAMLLAYASHQVWRGVTQGRITINGLADAERASAPILFWSQLVLHVVIVAMFAGGLVVVGAAGILRQIGR